MTICIQLLYTESWNDIAKIVVPNIVNYCRKHNYLWNVQKINEPYDAFEKIRQIQEIFENNEADVVMSIDCDAIITNYNFKIEEFIDDFHDLFICKDYNGINAGIFIIQNYEWSKWFIGFILSQKGKENIHCEQDAINSCMNDFSVSSHIKILQHPSINSYLYENYSEIPHQSHEQGQWFVNDFILHLPGLSMHKRIEILKDHLTSIIYE